jgi:hypothetical protein
MKQTISTDDGELILTWFDQADDEGDSALAEVGTDLIGLTADEAMEIYVWLQGRLEAAGLL